MAVLSLGNSTCSLCGGILSENDEVVTWTAFLNPDHKWWKYSDSGMHKTCFEKWEHQKEFEALYRYQPTIDFEDEHLKQQIEEYGMPDWLQKIKDYRNWLKKDSD